MNISQQETLTALVSHPVKWNCLLNKYTSFSIGGPADAVVTVDRVEELPHLLGFLSKEKIQWQVIGRGTNLLVKDSGFPGVILILGKEYRGIAHNSEDSQNNIEIKVGGDAVLAAFHWTVLIEVSPGWSLPVVFRAPLEAPSS